MFLITTARCLITNQWNGLIDWDGLSGLFVAATNLNSQLRDHQEFLFSLPFATTNNTTTRTTTSATFVEVTGASVSLTSYGGNMIIVCNGKVSNSGTGNLIYVDLSIDGARVGNATNGLCIVSASVANYTDCVNVVWMTTSAPSAASHTYSVFWKTSGGTASILERLYVMEIR